MAPRALGALLAIVAAIAFAVSIASSAWWAGHPTVEGQTITAKDVHVGPLGATGCNTGGDGSCEAVTTSSTMHLIGTLAIAAIGLAILFAFMLAVSAWRVGDRRKGLANATIVITLGAAGVGGVLLALGPGIEASQHIGVPIGWGTYVFGGAIASSLLASLITRKLEPEPLRLKPGVALPPPPDVRDLVREEHEGLAPRDSIPLFGAAPQLRPLYDPANQGYVPAPQTPSLPSQPPAPYGRAQVKELTGQYTPTPEKVNPLGSPNPGTQTPSAGPLMPRPGDPLGPPVDPFARTAPRDQAGEPPPMSPPPPRTAPSPTSRPRSGSAAPPPRTQSPSTPPRQSPSTPRIQSPSTAPRQSPSTAPPSRMQSPSTAPPRTLSASTAPPSRTQSPRTPSPSTAPPSRAGVPLPAPPRARTTQGPGTDPSARKLDAPAHAEPELRPSAPTLAHAIPPMPTPDNLPGPGVLPGRDVTAVEIDAEAKAVAEATARGQLDPRIAIRPARSSTDARTGQHDARIADVTSTGVDVDAAPRLPATTDENPIAPPPPNQRIITGEARALSTMQRQVARAPTEDPFGSGKEHLLVAAAPLTDELATPRSAEMAAEEAPVTEVHEIPSAHELADELAALSVSGSIGDVTAATSPADLHDRNSHTPTPTLSPPPLPETTPIPTFHGRPAFDSMSTASASLPPPRTVDTAPQGPTPACPQCESPMAWVEEHLRFYCKQCRMYF